MDRLLMVVDHYFGSMKTGVKNLFADKKGINEVVNIVLMLSVIVVIGAIGIFMADTTVTATGTPSNANLSTMQTNILGAGQTGSSFVVILIIAFIGGVALMYMFGFMGRGKR